MGALLNTEKFIASARVVLGDEYGYEKTVYVNAHKKVIVTCKVHGDFLITPDSHKRGSGCAKCKFVKVGNANRGNLETFLYNSAKEHGTFYNYSKVVYVSNQTKVIIGCPEHGDFLCTPNNHQRGRGCPKCKGNKISTALRDTKECFIEKAQKKLGNILDYSRVDYINNTTEVKIVCSIHGEFLQTPASHLVGLGCPHCSRQGFQNNKPGHVYILNFEDVTKIGITNRDVNLRVKKINRSSGNSFSINQVYSFESVLLCRKLEYEVLKWLEQNYQQENRKFDGFTECFLNVNQQELLNKVAEVLQSIIK